jgi:HlyD family secretion protein
MNKSATAILLLLLLLLLLLQSCGPSAIDVVQQERIEVVVSASGELESQQTAMIAPPPISSMWQYQIKQLVPENSKVKKGQHLVSFDDQEITERLVDKQAELDRAEKELENKKVKEEQTEQEMILSVAEKKMEFEKSKRKAEIVDNSRSVNDKRKAEIDFTIAENDLFLAKETLKYQQNNKILNVKLSQGKVNRITEEVNELNRDIERLKVKAPIDGMVIYKSNWQGEKPAVGESVQFGQPIVELAVVEKMQLKAQIDEPDSGKVALGQKVKISIDGTQNLVFQGKIISLGKVFRDKSSQEKRRVFDVIITFDKADTKVMRPGMTARIEVVTAVLDNVLTIPSTAVSNVGGKNIVNIVDFMGEEPKQIEISHIVGVKAVIAQGLSLGDEVAQ